MNISEEAVEAAAKVLLRGCDEGHHAYKIAYAALESAATYMLAEAWDVAMTRAAAVAWEHDASASSAIAELTNPYRSQP